MYINTYSFGMLMPNRSFNADGQRHLYHGMEQDMEVSGSGNSYTTEFRQYDPRLGRWKSLDALMYMFPHLSPYVGFDNNPIYFVDPYGLASEVVNGGGEPKKTETDENNSHIFVGQGAPERKSHFKNKSGKYTAAKDADLYIDTETNDKYSYMKSDGESGVWVKMIELEGVTVNADRRDTEEQATNIFGDFGRKMDNLLRGSSDDRSCFEGGTNYVGKNGNNDQAIGGGPGSDRQKLDFLPGATAGGGAKGIKSQKYRGTLNRFQKRLHQAENAKGGFDLADFIMDITGIQDKAALREAVLRKVDEGDIKFQKFFIDHPERNGDSMMVTIKNGDTLETEHSRSYTGSGHWGGSYKGTKSLDYSTKRK